MTPRPELTQLKDQQSSYSDEGESPKDTPIGFRLYAPDQPWSPPSTKTAAEINRTELNLHLGRSDLWSLEQNTWTLRIIRWMLCVFLVEYWEPYVFQLYNMLPIPVRRYFSFSTWRVLLPLHKYFFGNTTGIHPDVSLEYHALTSLVYWGRFFPANVSRMRFMLHQLTANQPSPMVASRIEAIDEFMTGKIPDPPAEQANFLRVHGLYLHYQQPQPQPSSTKPSYTEYTLFWVCGGAFMSGEAVGYMGPADFIASRAGPMDVFIPNYRLAPEYCMDDFMWDVCLSYRWLYDLRKQRGQDPNKILLFGCSSGAALCLRLMQSISELQQKKESEILPPYLTTILQEDMMPRGAALASPFLDFSPDLDPQCSLLHYCKHDIVSEPMVELGTPYLDTHMGRSGDRITQSPVQRSLEGLPPLCIVLSEHETVFDETVRLVEKARTAGVLVTVGLWKYMCHSFLFLNGFIPEGQQAVDFVSQWYRDMQQ